MVFAVPIVEFASLLGVSEEDVMVEARRGRIRVVAVNDKLRVVGESLDTMLAALSAEADHMSSVVRREGWSISRRGSARSFDHLWPDSTTEHFTDSILVTVQYPSHAANLLIGRCVRYAAGAERIRVVVFLKQAAQRRPLCEFVGGDNFEQDGLVVAAIKVDGSHVQEPAQLPAPLLGLIVKPYRAIADGPYAPHGLGVVCKVDDVDAMVTYALFRAEEADLL